MKKSLALAAVFGVAITGAAQAHMGLSVAGTAAPGTNNIFSFAPGHGCDAEPTTVMRIAIPAGIESVKPVAKPGWEIAIVTDAAGTITEIDFTGGSLPGAWYDTFSIRARVNAEIAPETHIYFPVIQSCPSGASYEWITIPAEGAAEPEEPAPGFEVMAAVAEAGHAH